MNFVVVKILKGKFVPLQQSCNGKGRRHQQTGAVNKIHRGRLGIYELMVMDDSLRDLVTGNPDVTHLRKLCRERGLVTLRTDGFRKVMSGLTTVDEVLRVTENSL